jgi:hypothetical protein
LKEGRTDVALGVFSEVTRADPTHLDAWWQLGWTQWALDDVAGAQSSWQRVKTLDPGHDDIDWWLSAAAKRGELQAVRVPAVDPPRTAEGRTLRFVAGGDTMMGSDLKKGPEGLPPGDGDGLFDDVRPILAGADVAFLNLEGPLADGLPSSKCGPTSTSCYAFRTPTRFAGALDRVGLDLASLANNHAWDVGSAGQLSSMKALDGVGIAHAGRYGDTALVDVNGTKVALVAAHSGTCCLNVNELAEVRAAVALADREADIVVFSFHGGAEGAQARHVPGKTEVAWGEERGDVRALAHAAIDAGADLVLGHGPHVLRAMEVYQGRLAAYSLGNFMGYRQFGTAGGFGATSVLLEAELAANGVLVSAKLHPIALDSDSVPHHDPAKAAFAQIAELSQADLGAAGVRVGPDGTLSWTP